MGVLQTAVRAAAAAAAISTMAAPALAVTLINRDKGEREAVINRNDGDSEVVTLKPGQRLDDICKTGCVILVGNTSVEAAGKATVVIENGKASLSR